MSLCVRYLSKKFLLAAFCAKFLFSASNFWCTKIVCHSCEQVHEKNTFLVGGLMRERSWGLDALTLGQGSERADGFCSGKRQGAVGRMDRM